MMAISLFPIVLLFTHLFIPAAIADQSKPNDVANETLSSVEQKISESDHQPEVAATIMPPLANTDPEPEIIVTTTLPQTDSDVLEKLFQKYDKSQHPRAWQTTDKNDLSNAVNITVNMYIRHLKIDHDKYEIQLTLRQEWDDPRLNFGRFGKVANYINLPPNVDVWMPDTFFQNELSAERHKIDTDNVLIRVEANGHVTYSTRLSLVVLCEQNFTTYPLDQQHCNLNMASYGHVQESVRYDWKSEKPIQYGPTTRIEKWLNDLDLIDAVPLSCTPQTASFGTYSCLQLQLNFKRRVCMYMYVLYLPTILLVAISWLAFWFHPDSQMSRLVVGVWSLLLVIMLIANSSVAAPHTYFLKASDIWNMTVLSFCFLALLESAMVTSAARKYRQRVPVRYHEELLENDKLMLREETPYYAQLVEEQPRSWAKRIDLVARIVFPLLFLVFNILYWINYLQQYM